jgi:hypothetical protein
VTFYSLSLSSTCCSPVSLVIVCPMLALEAQMYCKSGGLLNFNVQVTGSWVWREALANANCGVLLSRCICQYFSELPAEKAPCSSVCRSQFAPLAPRPRPALCTCAFPANVTDRRAARCEEPLHKHKHARSAYGLLPSRPYRESGCGYVSGSRGVRTSNA